jgi:hypothetical protein
MEDTHFFNSFAVELLEFIGGFLGVVTAVISLVGLLKRRSLVGRVKYLNKVEDFYNNPKKFNFLVTHEAMAIFILFVGGITCLSLAYAPTTTMKMDALIKQNPNSLTALVFRGEILFFALAFVGALSLGLHKAANLLILSSNLLNFEEFKQKQENIIKKSKLLEEQKYAKLT